MGYYGSESISSLKGAESLRQRPAVALGTNDENGIYNTINEIVTNSSDESLEGFGDEVVIKIFKDGDVRVTDFGRGVPMDWNEKEGKYAYELVFNTMFASGKLDSKNYKKSAGLNGVGCTATQYTSEYMDVYSVRDEIKSKKVVNGEEVVELERVRFEMHFKKGSPVGELKREVVPSDTPTGTIVQYKPDIKEVFKGASSAKIPIYTFIEKFRQKAMLSPTVKYVLEYDDKEPITFCYNNGIEEYLDEVVEKKMTEKYITVGGDEIGQDRDDTEEYRAYYDITFTFSRELGKDAVEYYHNQQELTLGGTSVDGFKSAVVKFFNTYGNLSKDARLAWVDFSDITVGVVSTYSPGHITAWKNQTKDAINNKFIGDLVYDKTYKALESYSREYSSDLDEVLSSAIMNKTAREKAESIKKSVIRELSKSTDSYRSTPNKLVRCIGKDKNLNELYIVEGDSAKGPVVLSRDAKTQAVLASRGKILNCQKATLEKVLTSEEILNFIRSLGCGIEKRAEGLEDMPEFDINKLNYDKIIICSDADDDGAHIDVLYITAIWYLCPSLIKYGKVYLVEAPLYAINTGSDKKNMIYAYNKKELERELENLEKQGVSKSKINIKRMKGLGESNASEMRVSIMDKNNRRLVKVEYPENLERFNILIESLMGNDTVARRAIINTYFDEEFEELEFEDVSEIDSMDSNGESARKMVLGF